MQSLAEAYTCPSKGIGSPTRCTIPPKQREGNAKRTDWEREKESERKGRKKIRRKRDGGEERTKTERQRGCKTQKGE